jgi:hypothetical protein
VTFLALAALFAVALLFGAMAFFAAVIAPVVFQALPSESAAP